MKFKVRIEYDRDCECPMEWDGQWTLHSFFNHHTSHTPPEDLGIEDNHTDGITVRNIGLHRKLQVGLAFPLSYGSEEWRICGLGSRHCDGILIWENKPSDMGAKTVIDRRKDAECFLKEYNAWANGDCYGYSVDAADEEADGFDSCWGFIIADKKDAEYFFDCIGDALPEGAEVEWIGERYDLAEDCEDVIRWLVDGKKLDVKGRIVQMIEGKPEAKALWDAVCDDWDGVKLGVLLDWLEENGQDVGALRAAC